MNLKNTLIKLEKQTSIKLSASPFMRAKALCYKIDNKYELVWVEGRYDMKNIIFDTIEKLKAFAGLKVEDEVIVYCSFTK